MTENKLQSYEECVAKYPVTYSERPFEISKNGKIISKISRKIKGPLVIPDGVEIVELNGQYRNDELTAFILPDSVKEIKGCFNGYYCEKFEFVRLSSNLSVIPKDLCYNCNIKNIILPDGIKEITYGAFQGAKINNLILPDTIEYIYPRAFEHVEIEELVLPFNLKVVCTDAFYKCLSLKKLEILSPETVIMKGAFEGCDLLASDLETLYKQHSPGNKIIGENEIEYSENGKELKYVPLFYCGPLKILDGAKKLSEFDIFRDCYGISELYFPNSFIYYSQSLPPYAETVRFPYFIKGAKPHDARCATSESGVSLEIKSKSLKNFNFPKNITSLSIHYTEIKRLSIPEGIETLSLEYMKHLEILDLPNSLETLILIGLPKLKSIQIPEGVKRLKITNCESLETINIPTGLEEIEEYSFCNNRKLNKIFIPNTVTKIGARAFGGCVNLAQIEIQGKPKPKISKSAFDGCPGWPIKK